MRNDKHVSGLLSKICKFHNAISICVPVAQW